MLVETVAFLDYAHACVRRAFQSGYTLISDPVGGQVAWLVAQKEWDHSLDKYARQQVAAVLGQAMHGHIRELCVQSGGKPVRVLIPDARQFR